MANSDERHPIVAGLVALVSVTAAVGAIIAIAAVVAAHVLGGGSNSATGPNAGPSMIVPLPRATHTPTGAVMTLPGQPSSTGSAKASSSPSHSTRHKKPGAVINLTASVVSASPMQQFNIAGTYQGGEGHILRLQRKNPGGAWTDFGVPDMDVQGGQFSTSVQTGHTGVNDFRVKDVDTGKLSNTVKVTID